MGVIFYFSSKTADASTEQSNVFVEWLKSLFGSSELWVFIVRKSAHILEFAGLSFLLNFALLYTRGKKSVLISLAVSSLYALSDEIHQIFVEGRSCEFRDWAIDTFGAVLGALGFLLLISVIFAITDKKRKKL